MPGARIIDTSSMTTSELPSARSNSKPEEEDFPITPMIALKITAGDDPAISFSKDQIHAAFVGATRVSLGSHKLKIDFMKGSFFMFHFLHVSSRRVPFILTIIDLFAIDCDCNIADDGHGTGPQAVSAGADSHVDAKD
jgi:hypothetical protein